VIYTRGFTAREILRKALTRTETGAARRVAKRRCASSENEKSFFTVGYELRAQERTELSEIEVSRETISVSTFLCALTGMAAQQKICGCYGYECPKAAKGNWKLSFDQGTEIVTG